MDLEAQRHENLKHKERLLAELNLQAKVGYREVTERKRPTKKRRLDLENVPVRSSARIATAGIRPSLTEDSSEKDHHVSRYRKIPPKTRHSNKNSVNRNPENDIRTLAPSADAEEVRAQWVKWEAAAKSPTRDEDGIFHFEDFCAFTPNKSPEEMMREGCFGGSYWRPLKSRKLGILIVDDYKELPKEWYAGLNIGKYMTSSEYDPEVNKYKVTCGQSIEEWEQNGWIAYEYDIRGWFQWYCRFFQGRRCGDDDRQVSRWRKCVGKTGRWRRMLLKKYVQMGVKEVFDDGADEETKEVSPAMSQTCHHWAYEVKQLDLDDFWKEGHRR